MPFTTDPNEHKAAMRALVIISAFVFAALTVVYLFGDQDGQRFAIFMGACFAFVTPIATALLAIARDEKTQAQVTEVNRKSDENAARIDEVHAKVNGGGPTVVTQMKAVKK